MAGIKFHIGHVVRILREEKRWTQKQLAEKAGTNKATIVSVEQMDRAHISTTYDRIAAAFGITAAELYAMVPTDKETQRAGTNAAAGGDFRDTGTDAGGPKR